MTQHGRIHRLGHCTGFLYAICKMKQDEEGRGRGGWLQDGGKDVTRGGRPPPPPARPQGQHSGPHSPSACCCWCKSVECGAALQAAFPGFTETSVRAPQ
jgi:hypothetical protein